MHSYAVFTIVIPKTARRPYEEILVLYVHGTIYIAEP